MLTFRFFVKFFPASQHLELNRNISLFFSDMYRERRQQFWINGINNPLDRDEYIRRIYGEPFSGFWEV